MAEALSQDSQNTGLVLRTEGLVKTYGKRTVVNHVSFDVKQGRLWALGPNGAGKTTSFYMTTGLVVPNEGRIFIGDLEITKFPVYKRARNGIGYLAQEASVFRKMTVEDNIASVLEMTGKPKRIPEGKAGKPDFGIQPAKGAQEFGRPAFGRRTETDGNCALSGHRP